MSFSIINGELQQARQVASPNFDERPDNSPIDLLVIHGISLPPGEFGGLGIEQLFTNQLDADEHPYYAEIEGLTVSAHVLIRRCGEVVQFVNFKHRAWHAGQSCFEGRNRCNDFSIGIELEGTDACPYEPVQYARLASLAAALMQAYPGITAQRVVGHSDIAPGRKTDPGEAFDWGLFRQLLENQQ
ncbi:MAG: 1,6-anhydro-N-acetylmuramyl-L-alanine amidase AmpD [Salinisphaeraceae bacterium]|nr:1,6-anhydro-N-acetylmuramyl-L-alanine amidase AmpD [Salinisphaeraceae bacterium]